MRQHRRLVQHGRRAAAAAVATLLAGSVVPSATGHPGEGGSRPAAPATPRMVCDPLDATRCLLPFPNDSFTVGDPTTATGRRLDLSMFATPRNVAGKAIDPAEWNRNDGFSPGSPVLVHVPGLDLHRTWGTADLPAEQRDHLADIARYQQPDAPIVLVNTATGERHPFWSELDSHPDTTDAERLLIARPAVNFAEGTRYIVALRDLRRSDGSRIEPGAAFASYRDGERRPNDDDHERRRPAMERIFGELAQHGIGREDLYLAWEFTVASERNLSERALTLRDEAFAGLGDHDLADGVVEGVPPGYEITSVTDFTPAQDRGTARRIEGTVMVPNYLTPQVAFELESPVDVPVFGSTVPVSLPLSRLNLLGSDDGLPARNPLQPDVQVPFVCNLPHGGAAEPAHPLLYGHGLLGSRGEANGSSTEDLRLRGFAPCAVDWWGMSSADLPNVAVLLADLSNFPSLPDRTQQGFLNFMFLGRALTHPAGMVTHPAFRTATGEPLIRSGELYYDGNSQGAILGGALVALAPDFERAVLGVSGMNYSTLLNRSVDWEGAYGDVLYATYPDKIDQQLVFALIQMLWDRGEANGYAHHATDDPLPGTPAHQIMLQLAYSDHQVANVAAEVQGRTYRTALRTPALTDGRHWSVDPAFGFDTVSTDATAGASYLVYWFSEERGNTTPPNGNVPPRSGTDPHGDPRKDNAGSDQVAHFLLTGELIDVCTGAPCVTTGATQSNG
ncbi:hypothetical protein BH20ACT2_BH20ACT2_00460 [soil metagenome]